jgi:complement C1q subcomponent subunit B
VFLFLPQNGRDVAFTAILSKDVTVKPNEVVKYDRMITNWGKAYQPSTGVFTAPYHGLYSFSCTLMAHQDYAVHVIICKNGKKQSQIFSNTKTYPQASQTLELELKRGDKITIQNARKIPGKLHDHGSYNIFSGFLVAEIFSAN